MLSSLVVFGAHRSGTTRDDVTHCRCYDDLVIDRSRNMPLPPVAAIAIRYGAVALIGWAAARSIPQGRRDQRVEDAFDELGEGVTLRRENASMGATARLRRVFRASPTASGVEIDLAVLSRLRIRTVPPE